MKIAGQRLMAPPPGPGEEEHKEHKETQRAQKVERYSDLLFTSFYVIFVYLCALCVALNLIHNQLVTRAGSSLQHLRCGGIDLDLVSQSMHQLFEQLAIARTLVTP